MIAKHVAMKTVQKSDFSSLAKYIADGQVKRERVGCVTVTNCHSDRLDAAIMEALNTQAQNTRSSADKTYHLIVSFRPNEHPGEATLKAIEARLCEGLGFGEHQRVSAVHHDTDNLHIHIAINKIHPARYTIVEPFNAYHTLSQLCGKLESEYGLERDNHQRAKLASQSLAQDMERHAGVQSLLGWIQRECSDDMQAAPSWQALHQVLLNNGLVLRERGNGLVIQATDGLAVKASAVGREFSKAKLQERLGMFKPSPEQLERVLHKPRKQYDKRPVPSSINTAALYAAYQAEQLSLGNSRTLAWAKAREKKDRLIEAAKRSGRLKRSAIRLISGAGVGKKLMYLATSKTLRADIESISKQYLKERQEIHDKYQRRAWADWLRVKAQAGDQQALAALRARQAAQSLKGNTVSGTGAVRPQAIPLKKDSVTKTGAIIYRVGATAVRDDGEQLKVSPGADQDGVQAALRMAMDRYGECIRVGGTPAFMALAVQAAAASKLPITFDEAALERRRQELLTPTAAKESHHDRAHGAQRGEQSERAERTERADSADRGRVDSRGDGAIGRAAAAGNPAASARADRDRWTTADTSIAVAKHPGKPNVGRIGQKPPPPSQNRLRSLSELSVVHLASRGEVLLPGDVSRDMEQQSAQRVDGVRRGISGPGGVSAEQGPRTQKDIVRRREVGANELKLNAFASEKAAAMQAAVKNLAEQTENRLRIFDIKKKSRYAPGQDNAIFAGIGQVEGHWMALLKRGEELMALPVDEPTAVRLKRMALGSAIAVTPQGAIKAKGRSR